MNIADLVRRQSVAMPWECSYVCGHDEFNWLETDRRSSAFATRLARDLRPGERVAILGRSCHRYWEAHFACAKAGLVSVPINHRLVASEVVGILRNVGATALVFDVSLGFSEQDARAIADQVEPGVVIAYRGTRPNVELYESVIEQNLGNDPARVSHPVNAIGYTSGTTGEAKGAMLSQHAATTSALWFAALFNLRTTSRFLACMPAYVYRAGAAGLAPVVVGARTIVIDFDAAAVLAAIEHHRVTDVILAPAMVDRLLAHPDLLRRDLSSLTGVWIGGAPTSTKSVLALASVVGDVVGSVYGMTEATGIASTRWSIEDEPLARGRLASVGRPSPLYDFRLVGADGREAPRGEPGEIVVRGPCVMDGYWRDPRGADVDHREFATGDIAVQDRDGYIYIVDRRADVINSGGLNVYTVEVEKILLEHPSVVDCSVVGAPDDTWGETPYAYVVAAPGVTITVEELFVHCGNRLARFKQPRLFEVVDELPRNAMGKVDKVALRASLWSDAERSIAGSTIPRPGSGVEE